jgi:N-ethylmaleimide reductase
MPSELPRRYQGPHDPQALFQPLLLGRMQLPNRIVLAPCTRNRALADLSPTAGAIDYFAARADAGLLITEATLITPQAQGFLDTPGIFLDQHVRPWAAVTDAVHRRGGRIFLQIWHTGRVAHSHFQGAVPMGPSAVLDHALRHQVGGLEIYNEMPVVMSEQQIGEAIRQFGAACVRADQAGFDGVEIHGANGYLPEQFLRQHTNLRTDDWGGSEARRARFTLEVVDACCAAIGPARVGLRLSPAGTFSEMQWTPGDNETYELLIDAVRQRDLAYLHTGITEDDHFDRLGATSTGFLRQRWHGPLIGNGGYTPAAAAANIAAGAFDLIAFGKLFIANPDLVERLSAGRPPLPYRREMLDGLL